MQGKGGVLEGFGRKGEKEEKRKEKEKGKKREKEEKSNGGKKKEAEKDYKNEGREKAFLFLKFSKLQIEKKNVSPIQIPSNPFEGNNGSICFRYLKPRFIVTFHLALVKLVCRKILVNKSCCPEESHNQ